MEEEMTMRPWLLFLRCGTAALMARKVPLRLVFITSSQPSGVISSILACGKMPALAHSTSRPPWRSTAVLAAACMSASLVTSPAQALAVPPAFVSSSAVASASLRLRATISTLAPWPANTLAMPLPMPLLPPVTMTDLPFRDADIGFPPIDLLFQPCSASQHDEAVATEQQDGGGDGRDGAEHRHARRVAGDHLGIEIFGDGGVRA